MCDGISPRSQRQEWNVFLYLPISHYFLVWLSGCYHCIVILFRIYLCIYVRSLIFFYSTRKFKSFHVFPRANCMKYYLRRTSSHEMTYHNYLCVSQFTNFTIHFFIHGNFLKNVCLSFISRLQVTTLLINLFCVFVSIRKTDDYK